MDQVFDHVANPELIQLAWGFYAAFAVAGLVVCTLAALAIMGRWKLRYFLAVFAPIWTILAVVLMIRDAHDVLQIRDAVRHGKFTTVEGCLSVFHAGSPRSTKSAAGSERWSLGGNDFDYGTGEGRPGYHLVEANGGLVHADSRVRVSFVRSAIYDRNEIVRLQTLDRTCPPAPDVH